jgi:hypothetical protein
MTRSRYSYSGTHRQVPSLQCTRCSQWFYMDELQLNLDGTITHLPFQRNYKFTCKWCGDAGVET